MHDLNLIDQVVLDRYRINAPLGEGAMGSVYLATDIHLNRQVALKVLRAEWACRPEVVKRLENECRLMARLGPHNNIVTLFDRLTYEGNAVLVLEYVPGEDLADVLVRTRSVNAQQEATRKTTPVLAGVSSILLTPSDAINIALQCLAGLDYAHSRGVLHRDIKPSNIMVARDHNGNIVAKIMDFGIGKLLSDPNDSAAFQMTALTQAGGPGPGTPAYMAPEQIDPSRFGALSPASDLYAFGVTLYEMLTLHLPFDGTYTELLHLHTNVEPPDPRKLIPTLGPGLAGVVLKSLRKNPLERYQSAHLFSMELQAEARKAFGAGGGGDIQRGGEKKSALGLALGSAAALALVGFGVYSVLGGSEDKATPPESPPVNTAPVTPVVPETPPAPVTPAPAAPEPLKATQASVAALDQEVGAAMASRAPGEVPPEALKAREAKQAGDAAFAAGDWPLAETKYTEARGLYESLKSAPVPSTNQDELYAKSEQQNAAEARLAAEKRFADGKADIAANASFATATKTLADADSALGAGDWKTAAAGYKQAQVTFGGMNPPPPAIAVTEPAPAPAAGPVTAPASAPMANEPAPVKKPEPVKVPAPEPPVDTAAKKAAERAKSAAAEAKQGADSRFKGLNANGNDTYNNAEALRAEGERLYKKGDYNAAKEKMQAATETFEKAKPTSVF